MSSDISASSESKLTELEEAQASYAPNESVAEQLRQKTLIMLVGPSCIGKSVIMKEVVQADKRFGITGTFTTRDKRDDDEGKNYTYIPHTDEGLAGIFSAVEGGQIVQYAVHPTSQRIYGSVLADYPKDFNMLDTLSTAVEAIEKLPAKKTFVIGVVVEPAQWREWFDARFPEGHPDRTKRIEEAAQSLTWLLNRPNGSIAWVVNANGAGAIAAAELIAVATNNSSGVASGRENAEVLLKAIKDMQ